MPLGMILADVIPTSLLRAPPVLQRGFLFLALRLAYILACGLGWGVKPVRGRGIAFGGVITTRTGCYEGGRDCLHLSCNHCTRGYVGVAYVADLHRTLVSANWVPRLLSLSCITGHSPWSWTSEFLAGHGEKHMLQSTTCPQCAFVSSLIAWVPIAPLIEVPCHQVGVKTHFGGCNH